MIKKESVSFIEGTPAAIRTYSIKNYIPHWHDNMLELIFVLKGKIRLMASYDKYKLEEGDFVLLNSGDPHYLLGDGDNVVISLYLDLNWFEEKYPFIKYISFICESFSFNSFQEEYEDELWNIIARIVVEASKQEIDVHKLNEAVDEFVNMIILRFDMANYYAGKELPEEQLQRYHRIMKEIEENYAEKIDLEQLANKEFIGKTYLSQFWKKITGTNFTEYLNCRRSEKAERLLLATDMSINEISINCGFSDTKYIYKNFKKWYNSTPSVLKKKYQELSDAGNDYKEYDGGQLLVEFGKDLIDWFVDEDQNYLIRSTVEEGMWINKLEKSIVKDTDNPRRRERTKENHKELGLSKIFIPLLDDESAWIEYGNVQFDHETFENIISIVKDMNYTLCIEMQYEKRTKKQWKQLISALKGYMDEKFGENVYLKVQLWFYFYELEKEVELIDLIEEIEEFTNKKNIFTAIRFG